MFEHCVWEEAGSHAWRAAFQLVSLGAMVSIDIIIFVTYMDMYQDLFFKLCVSVSYVTYLTACAAPFPFAR